MKEIKACSLALGTFDGVHLGHRKVIEAAVKYAKENGLTSVVLTFDPHPKSVVVPERHTSLLTTIKERICDIKALGADRVVVIKFNKKLMNMPYQRFAKEYIKNKYSAEKVFVGEDYTFGRNREGNLARLGKTGKEYGFSVEGVKDKTDAGQIIKSTLIRGLMKEGDFNSAVKLLGHPYLICGRVVKGEGVGALIGYPTANIGTEEPKLIPADGVHACCVCIGNKTYKGAVSIGRRPTFSGRSRTIEVFIIGFHGNIRGRDICIGIIKMIRKERKFRSVKELTAAIGRDVKIAKRTPVC